jgi:hypothetical protein
LAHPQEHAAKTYPASHVYIDRVCAPRATLFYFRAQRIFSRHS